MAKERKPLPKGFIDPLDTQKAWRPQSAREIFGSPEDVFGKKRSKAEKDEEPETTEGTEGDDEDEE